MRHFTIILAFLAVLPTDGMAASFDCGKARTDVEKMICSDERLSRADERMAALYKELRSQLPEKVQRDTLHASQVKWLTVRNRCDSIFSCLLAYGRRIAKLREELVEVTGKNATLPVEAWLGTWVWESKYHSSGIFTLTTTGPDEIAVKGSVVLGLSARNGTIDGVFDPAHSYGAVVIREHDCEIELIHMGDYLLINELPASAVRACGGAGVRFANIYERSPEFTPDRGLEKMDNERAWSNVILVSDGVSEASDWRSSYPAEILLRLLDRQEEFAYAIVNWGDSAVEVESGYLIDARHSFLLECDYVLDAHNHLLKLTSTVIDNENGISFEAVRWRGNRDRKLLAPFPPPVYFDTETRVVIQSSDVPAEFVEVVQSDNRRRCEHFDRLSGFPFAGELSRLEADQWEGTWRQGQQTADDTTTLEIRRQDRELLNVHVSGKSGGRVGELSLPFVPINGWAIASVHLQTVSYDTRRACRLLMHVDGDTLKVEDNSRCSTAVDGTYRKVDMQR